MISLWQILLAVIVDLALGDPKNWPHPVRWVAVLAEHAKTRALKAIANRRQAGILAGILVHSVMLLGLFLATWIMGLIDPWLGWLVGVVAIYWSIAARDLANHVWSIAKALIADNLGCFAPGQGKVVGN